MEGVWCIGDANGKLMLAHAASAQGIAAIECMNGRDNVLNHNSVPAACFTHPEVSFVGLTEEQARAKGEEEGFEVVVKKTSFKANSKALAEKEADGMAKLIYRPDTEEILGMWIMGLHAADLIHEASNAINMGQEGVAAQVRRARAPHARGGGGRGVQAGGVDRGALSDEQLVGCF